MLEPESSRQCLFTGLIRPSFTNHEAIYLYNHHIKICVLKSMDEIPNREEHYLCTHEVKFQSRCFPSTPPKEVTGHILTNLHESICWAGSGWIVYESYHQGPIHTQTPYKYDFCLSSVESQKGVNDVQGYSVENHKGAIAVQSLWR